MTATISGIAAVAGVGLRQYKRAAAPLPEMGNLIRAIEDACEDAGLPPSEIDGFATYGDDKNEAIRMMPHLGLKELRWNSQVFGGGGGGIAGAIGHAVGAIATKQASAVIVYRALAQSSSGRLSAAVMAHHLNAHIIGAGLVSPANLCALRAQRLMEYHGVPWSTVENFVHAAAYHGSRNPGAVNYGTEFDLEGYRNSRWITEPFRLFDCSRENDGAGALLIVSAERAKDLKKKPVHIAAVAQGAAEGWGDLLENDEADQYATTGFRSVAKNLWEQSGLSPTDIDVAQIYENFSAQAIMSMIDHGLCTYENVAEVAAFENMIAPTGKLPVNTAGGNLSQGFIHGIGMPIEAVQVLRGESANPVPDAKVCLLAGGPGAPTVSSAIFSNELV